MKLDPEAIAYILKVVKTAKLVNIENVIIEPNIVRAIDDAKSVVLLQDKNVVDLPFGSIGLTRLDELLARYEIASSREKFSIEAVAKPDEDFARSIVMKGKGIKVDYRCGNPANIKCPRQVNETMMYSVDLNSEAVTLLQKGVAAMGAEVVSIISNEGVSFELADTNNDVFKHTFADDAEPLTSETNTTFAHRYPVKILLAIFKTNSDGKFSIGAKGTLQFKVNGITTYVLPRV